MTHQRHGRECRLAVSFILPFALFAGTLPAGAQTKPKPQTPPKAGEQKPPAKPAATKPAPKPAAAAAAPAPKPAAQNEPSTWALLVGVSQYAGAAGVKPLNFPAADATSIREALTNPDMGNVPAENVKLLTDAEATRSAILGAVDAFLKPNVKPGDRVVVFLAGHGVAKGVGTEAKSYFLPHDVTGYRKEQLDASAVNLRELADKLSDLPASQFVVFLDACREDPIPGRGIKGNHMTDVMSRGMTIVPRSVGSAPISAATFFACSVGQRAFEDPAYNHGVFTYHILEGVKKVAQPQNGEIDLALLAQYVEKQVVGWAKKTSDTSPFEVEQTPELVASTLANPIIVLRLQKPPADTAPLKPEPPTLFVASEPAGAQVLVNGRSVGVAPVSATLPGAGEYAVSLAAPGFAPVERQVKVFDGYPLQIEATLAPGGRGSAAPSGRGADLYRQAQEEIKREQWEVADADSDPRLRGAGGLRPRLPRRRPSFDVGATATWTLSTPFPSR